MFYASEIITPVLFRIYGILATFVPYVVVPLFLLVIGIGKLFIHKKWFKFNGY